MQPVVKKRLERAVAQAHHLQFFPVEINHVGVLVSDFAGS